MLGKDLAALIRSGNRPVVTLLRGVEDQETYLEEGMRGRLVSVLDMHDDLLRFSIDLTEFEAFNAAFESINYYDKQGKPTLTARQAGYYKPIDEVWGSLSCEVFVSIEGDARVTLYERFLSEHSTKSYVHWLEDQVLSSTAVREGD